MSILEICNMMLLLDCSNPIVVHSMALKHGSQAWRSDSPDYKRICISWNKSVRNILRLPHTTHTWILGPLLGQTHIQCQLQQRTLRFLCSIQNNNNTLVSACWKYANNNANSPLGYNIAYFRNSYGIVIFHDVCVKKIIHPPRLDNEQHMIISELKVLEKCRKNLIGHSRLAFNNHELNIDC